MPCLTEKAKQDPITVLNNSNESSHYQCFWYKEQLFNLHLIMLTPVQNV